MSSEAQGVVTLWRPVGPRELELIRESGMRAFPPRLPEQPIFYPVLSEEYAVKIARAYTRRPGVETRSRYVIEDVPRAS